MLRLCARWLYWRYRVYRAERRPSGPLGRALARFWCTLWLHPGDWFGWQGFSNAASPVPLFGGLSGVHREPPLTVPQAFDNGTSLANLLGGAVGSEARRQQLQAAQLGSLSYTPWPGLKQALANVPPEARGYSSQPSLLALLNASNPYGR